MMEKMVKIIKKFMEMIKRKATECVQEIKIYTFFAGKTTGIKSNICPKALGLKIIVDNIFEIILSTIAVLSLFTEVNKKPLKMAFSGMFIGGFIINLLIDKAAEKEIKENGDPFDTVSRQMESMFSINK